MAGGQPFWADATPVDETKLMVQPAPTGLRATAAAPAASGGPMPTFAATPTAPPAPKDPLDRRLKEIQVIKAERELTENQPVETPGDITIGGDEYLKTIDPRQAAQVKALSEGRLPIPSGRALSQPYWQRLLQMTAQYDPSFDAANAATRRKTRLEFTSGVPARNIASFNTAIGHLGRLAEHAKALNNTWSPDFNTVGNLIHTKMGDPRVTNFNETRQAVASELERAFRGTGGSLTGVQEWEKSIDSSNSPAQLQGAIKGAVDLLDERIAALGDQYNAGMGKSTDPILLLSETAQKTRDKLLYPEGKPAEGEEKAPPGPGDIGFSGNVPPETVNPLTDQQQAAYEAWRQVNKKPTAQQLVAFFDGIGATINPANAKAIEEAVAVGAEQRPASEATAGPSPEQEAQIKAAVDKAGGIGAGVKGAADTVTMGAADKGVAALTAAQQAFRGEGGFKENYTQNLMLGNAYDEALQRAHPNWYTGGQVAGAFGIPAPTGVSRAGFAAAKEALAAGATKEAAKAAAVKAAAGQLGKEGMAYSGAYGVGSSDTLAEVPGNFAEAAATGGAAAYGLGRAAPALGEAVAPVVKWIGGKLSRESNIDDAAMEIAQAAEAESVSVPGYVTGGKKAQAEASALEKTPGGYHEIGRGQAKMHDTAEAARDRAAEAVGTPAATREAMGGEATAGAKQQIETERARVGETYQQAKDISNDQEFLAWGFGRTMRQFLKEKSKGTGGSAIKTVLQRHLDDLDSRGGKLSIDGARETRTNLRTELRTEAGLTAKDADRIVSQAMGALNKDIERGLKTSGKHKAIPLYKEADADWAAQLALEDDVLKHYIGKDGDAWGSEVAKRINEDIRANPARAAKFINAQPPEVANNIRAHLIGRLGRAKSGQQDAPGEVFSLDEFLTNWDSIKESRNQIFGKDTVKSLNNLAIIASGAKKAGRASNRSNTGFPAMAAAKQAAGHVLGAAALSQADWKLAASQLAVGALYNMKNYRAARLLASDAFTKKLAATPKNPKGAVAYWSRPWVQNMARANPAIASELLEFQKHALAGMNDNQPAEEKPAAAR